MEYLLRDLANELRLIDELPDVSHQRHHDLDGDFLSLARHVPRRLEDRLRLHLGDLGVGDAQAAAAVAQHRVRLPQGLDQLLELRRWDLGMLGEGCDLLMGMRQELVQRRVEQPDRDGQAVHHLEDPLEVAALDRQEFRQRLAAARLVSRDDHLPHEGDAVTLEEHVLGAAEPDPLGAEFARPARIGRNVGVGAHPHPTLRIRPRHEAVELFPRLGGDELRRAEDDAPRRPVDGNHLTPLDGASVHAEPARGRIDVQLFGAYDARLAHAPGDDRGVTRHAATGGQDRARGNDAVVVLGRRLRAHEDHIVALFLEGLGFVGIEHDLTGRRSRRGGQSLGEHRDTRFGIDHGMKQLIEILGWDALHGLVFGDQPFRDHLHGGAHGGHASALRSPRLQHVELAMLEREFDVLHILEVLLEFGRQAVELTINLGEFAALHFLNGLWRPRAGHDVLALRVRQYVAVQHVLAGAAVSRERHARTAVVAHVAVDHRDDVHGGPQTVGNPVDLAVILGATRVPTLEDRLDRTPQLLVRIVGEGLPGAPLDDRLEVVHQVVEIVGGEIDVAFDLAARFCLVELVLERILAEIEDDVAIHLYEAAIGIVREARVLGPGDQPLHRLIVQAKVEDRLHHARHRHRGPRADRNQQRILGVAEPLLGDALQMLQVAVDLGAERGRKRPFGDIGDAEFGGDRKAGRDRQAEVGHFGEAGAFPAQDVTHRGGAVGAAVAEGIDVAFNGHTAIMAPKTPGG